MDTTKDIYIDKPLVFKKLYQHFKKSGEIQSIRIFDRFVMHYNFGFALVKMKDGRFAEVKIANNDNDNNQFKLFLTQLNSPVAESTIDQSSSCEEDSLNLLNDDCWKEVFERVRLDDLSSVIDVCTKFREIGMKIASIRLSKSETFTCDFTSNQQYNQSKCLMRTENFLRYFGTKIKSIDFRFNWTVHLNGKQFDEEFFKSALYVLLAYYADNQSTLNELKITEMEIPMVWHRPLWSIFSRLTHIHLKVSRIGGLLDACDRLICLKFDGINPNLVFSFGYLDDPDRLLNINNFKTALQTITEKTEVKCVHLNNVIDSMIIDLVISRFPNLTELMVSDFGEK